MDGKLALAYRSRFEIMVPPSANNPSEDEDTFMQDCLAGLSGGKDLAANELQASESPATDCVQEACAAEAGDVQEGTDDSSGTASPEPRAGKSSEVLPMHLATSTFLSLVMVLGLLLIARMLVPSLVESIRYSWYRGQLRAEYELSSERLRHVSLDSLSDVSQLVSQKVGPSVAHINLLRDEKTLEQFESVLGGRAHPSLRYEGQGSGFVIDSNGYLLTNNHVVEGVGAIEVTLSDGRQLPAKIVGADPLTDLAVLKVQASGLLPIEWGESEGVVVGTPVWAVGSPFGLQQTVTFGIISGKHRVDFRGTRDAEGIHGSTPYGDLMQSDVALNPGNSGGPLVNSLGQVVGVNAAILGDTFRGISFSIPSKVAQQVAMHLMHEGQVPRGWLGVQLEDLSASERFLEDGTPRIGIRVLRLLMEEHSPAGKAGIKAGDLLLSYEGIEVTSTTTLIRMIGESRVGHSVAIEVQRGESRLSFQVELQRRDESAIKESQRRASRSR